ncbi:MAG: hypothetical protein V1904_12000 [Bacteroidota bacterium]
MKTSDALFILIHSLEKNEKTYFRKYAAIHAGGNGSEYMKLFGYIEKQSEYNEKEIISALLVDKKACVENISRFKNHLYHLILKCLRSYHSHDNIESELNGMLADIAFLFNKNMHKECRKLILKAKRTAAFYEKFSYQIEILKWERRVIMIEPRVKKIEKELKANFDDDRHVLEKIDNIAKYNRESMKMFVFLKKIGRTRDSRTIDKYRGSLNKSMFADVNLAVSYSAKMHYYRALCSYYLNIGDSKKSYIYNKKLISLMKQNPHQINDDPGTYLAILNNQAIRCSQLKKFAEFRSLIDEMRNIPGKFPAASGENFKQRIFCFSYSLECDLYIESGKVQEALKLMDNITEGLEIFKGKISIEREVLLWYQMSCVYFTSGNFSASLNWNNKILNVKKSEVRIDIYGFSRIFNLMIHYELNNFDLLEYNIRATYRYFKEKQKLFRLEKLFFDFLKQASQITDNKMLIVSFKKFRKLILPLKNDPYEKRVFEFFDFLSWIDSKIENKNLTEIIEKKMRRIKK